MRMVGCIAWYFCRVIILGAPLLNQWADLHTISCSSCPGSCYPVFHLCSLISSASLRAPYPAHHLEGRWVGKRRRVRVHSKRYQRSLRNCVAFNVPSHLFAVLLIWWPSGLTQLRCHRKAQGDHTPSHTLKPKQQMITTF